MKETMVINFSNPISSTNSDFSAVHQKSISVSIKGEDRSLLEFRERIIDFINVKNLTDIFEIKIDY